MRLRASGHRADASLWASCSLSSARQAVVLTPSLSTCDAINAV
ncbi:hypothetical protein OAO87_03800 [bacterium]|nr:hypothetical protein [bacterium]